MFEHLVQLLVNGLITGSILALTGVGASLVFGIQRIANFAHGDYLTVGAVCRLRRQRRLASEPGRGRRQRHARDGGLRRWSPTSACSDRCAAAAPSPSRSSPSAWAWSFATRST